MNVATKMTRCASYLRMRNSFSHPIGRPANRVFVTGFEPEMGVFHMFGARSMLLGTPCTAPSHSLPYTEMQTSGPMSQNQQSAITAGVDLRADRKGATFGKKVRQRREEGEDDCASSVRAFQHRGTFGCRAARATRLSGFHPHSCPCGRGRRSCIRFQARTDAMRGDQS